MERPPTLTVDEVNERLPLIRHHFDQIVRLRQQLVECNEGLRTLGVDVDGGYEVSSSDSPEIRLGKDRFRLLLKAVAKEIGAIEAMGAVVKDLNLGLIDFYGEIEERAVFFCWQYGEDELLYWHELDQGYSNRRPIYPGRDPLRH
jgi:hypothetical protein